MSGINLSFHGMKDYLSCPKKYHLKYIKRQKPKDPENKKNAFFGNLTAGLLENWIKSGTYKKHELDWLDWLPVETEAISSKLLEREYIIWDSDNELPENINLAIHCMPKCFNTLKEQGLLDGKVIAEAKAKIPYGSNEINGRIDLLSQNNNKIFILDGKSGKSRDKFLDSDQLYYYVIIVKAKLGNWPIEIGYQYTRFGDIDWYDVDPNILDGVKSKIIKSFEGIENGVFGATPSNDSCRFCPYREECTDKLINKRTRESNIGYDCLGQGLGSLDF